MDSARRTEVLTMLGEGRPESMPACVHRIQQISEQTGEAEREVYDLARGVWRLTTASTWPTFRSFPYA